MKFRKKPVVIDAWQWEGIWEFAPTWLQERRDVCVHSHSLTINTLEGVMSAARGDWIIRGVQGEVYPCKPEIFEATYEPVASEVSK